MFLEVIASLCIGIILAKACGFFAKSKNPFSKDSRRPPEPVVVDQDKRDKVLKNGYTKKKVPENLDAIVVGSGIGGLSTAALMAKAGKKVLVLEQHDQAGGCCHTFIDKGFEFDVGIHYIGEMQHNSELKVLLDQITEGQLVWAPMNDHLDTVVLGSVKKGTAKKFAIEVGSAKRYATSLRIMFPDELEAIGKYMKLLSQAEQAGPALGIVKLVPLWMARFLIRTGLLHWFTRFFTMGSRSLSEVLAELTQNEELRAVLSYNFGDMGALPDETPFVVHALLNAHFLKGASYPRGGASEIAFHIIPVIERSGGSVLVRAPVESIILDQSNTAIGVRVSRSSGETDEIFAPLIISDAGIFNTYQTLLPEHVRNIPQIVETLSHAKHGVGAMAIYIGLDGSKKDLNLPCLNVWSFVGGSDINGDSRKFLGASIDDVLRDNVDVPLVFASFPSAKDPTWDLRYPGKSTCTIVTFAPWSWFEQWEHERVKKRGDDYDSIKDQLARKAWNQFLELYPELESKVEYFQVGTPLSNKYYIGAPKGEIYGLHHDVFVAFLVDLFDFTVCHSDRFRPEAAALMRSETPIKNLILTGQDICSCGFAGALLGGVFAAGTALKRVVFGDLLVAKLWYK